MPTDSFGVVEMLPGHTAGRIAWMLLVLQLMGGGGWGAGRPAAALGSKQTCRTLPPPSQLLRSGDKRALLVAGG